MSVTIIFKIAALGIVVAVLSQILKHSGREEQAFLDEVCVCMRNHQNPSGQKIWQDCLQKHKRELQIGQEGWEILTSAAGAFYGESSAENLRCNEICRKRMEKFLAESRLEFFKKQRVYLPVGMLTGVVMIILLV